MCDRLVSLHVPLDGIFEVRSLKEERDRLHASVAAAEDAATALGRDKARFQQQGEEAEGAVERCRVSCKRSE
jgi:hypothetical protein